MKVKLFLNATEPNRVHKVLESVAEVEGYLRDGSSVIDPSIIIDSEVNLALVNYIEIPEFGRKYFVTNISTTFNKCWEFTCHVDVLSTYYEFYSQLPCIVARNEYENNKFLPDDRFLVNANRNYQVFEFPRKLKTSGGASYVITISGGATAET